jgi:hypothetical protein
MASMRNVTLTAVSCVMLCALALAAKGPDLPPAPIRPKVRTACLECHDAGIIRQQRLDRKSWQKVVDKMVRWGALVEPGDREPMLDYLTANFGPEKNPQPTKTASTQKPQGK